MMAESLLNTNGHVPGAFQYVDSAIGGVSHRNNIIKISDVDGFGQAEVYTTHRRFNDDFPVYVQNHRNGHGKPSVKGYDGECWAPDLPLDFDCEDNPTRALEWLRSTLAKLQNYGVDLRSVQVYYSGHKGFHAQIPAALFGGFCPSKDLHERLKRAAQTIMGDVPFDQKIYDKTRLWRVPNTLNEKSGLYKVPLSVDEALSLTLDQIRGLAMQPRPIEGVPDRPADTPEPVPALVEIWAQAGELPPAPAADAPAHAPTTSKKPTTSSAYGSAALNRELKLLRHTTKGDRNNQLNASAFALGQLVAGGEVALTDALERLRDTARAIGLNDDEIRPTIASGVRAGMQEPRQSPSQGRHVEGMPQIRADEQDLRIATEQAWDAVRRGNTEKPFWFRHGSVAVRIEFDDHGRPMFRPIDKDRARHGLARVAEFTRTTKNGERIVVLPPSHVVADVLATPDPDLPIVSRITETPVFGPDGSLRTVYGYHAAAKTFCAIPDDLRVPPIAAHPGAEHVAFAKKILIDELLSDFPFRSQADRANAVALGLLPYVRDLIDGPTPLHLIEAPIAGSGKGLLGDALLLPSCGRSVGAMAQAENEDEWRKRITAVLHDGFAAVHIDNVTRSLDSGNLASALTALVWNDRLMGTSSTVSYPVRCVWLASANNPSMSTEVARRCVRIRLDAGVDRPWERSRFRHPNLRAWALERRGLLIWAYCTLIQSWLAAGRPACRGKMLGSFEDWSRVIGGILEHVGMLGFLSNLNAMYEQADLETTVWRRLVEEWWDRYQSGERKSGVLFEIAAGVDGFDLGEGTPKSQQTRFGMALRKQQDRVIGGFRIVAAGERQGAALWRLLPVHAESAGE